MWRALLIVPALAACAQFPQLDETIEPSAEAAEFPDLVPLEPILADLARAPDRNARTQDTLEARAAALRSKAAGLRHDVVDGETQDRMRRGVPQS